MGNIYIAKGMNASNNRISGYMHNVHDNLGVVDMVCDSMGINSITIHGASNVNNQYNIEKYVATFDPIDTVYADVIWSIVGGTNCADIDKDGFLYVFPDAEGDVTIRCTSTRNLNIYCDKQVHVKSNFHKPATFKGIGLLMSDGTVYRKYNSYFAKIGSAGTQDYNKFVGVYTIGLIIGNGGSGASDTVLVPQLANRSCSPSNQAYKNNKFDLKGQVTDTEVVCKNMIENGYGLNEDGSVACDGPHYLPQVMRVSKIGAYSVMCARKAMTLNDSDGGLQDFITRGGNWLMSFSAHSSESKRIYNFSTKATSFQSSGVDSDKWAQYSSDYAVISKTSYGGGSAYQLRLYGIKNGVPIVGKNSAYLSGSRLVVPTGVTLTDANWQSYLNITVNNNQVYTCKVAENVINLYFADKVNESYTYTVESNTGVMPTLKSGLGDNATFANGVLTTKNEITYENVGNYLNVTAQSGMRSALLVIGTKIRLVYYKWEQDAMLSSLVSGRGKYENDGNATMQGCALNVQSGKLYQFYKSTDGSGCGMYVYDYTNKTRLENRRLTSPTSISGSYHMSSANFDVNAGSASTILYGTDTEAGMIKINVATDVVLKNYSNHGDLACVDESADKVWWHKQGRTVCYKLSTDEVLGAIGRPSCITATYQEGDVCQDMCYDKARGLVYVALGYGDKEEKIAVYDVVNNKFAGMLYSGVIGESEGITVDGDGNIILIDANQKCFVINNL